MPAARQFFAFFLLLISGSNGQQQYCSTTGHSAVAVGRRSMGGRAGATAANISVPVYFHALAPNETTLLDDATLQAQFDVLYEAYKPHNIIMSLAGITKTINATWAQEVENPANEWDMKTTLRKGDYKTLNFYFQDMGPWTNGRCFYPVPGAGSQPESRDFILDGCQVNYNTVPGGSAPNGSNGGKLAVHEAGHWFGLPHTFQGGCADTEGIADTPAHAGSSWTCTSEPPLDTCPDQPGLDPVHNYMNYGPE
ncbi:metalloprotease 1 [Paramyrothecium foliicola]|nr:metalloprotease 1 [Paramyrothecium foliicola]